MFAHIAGLFAGLLVNANVATMVDTHEMEAAGLDQTLFQEAIAARNEHAGDIKNDRFITIIDYRKPSSEKRLYLIDTEKGTVEAMLVAHGQGSDANHDGMADTFSNVPQSKMTSLGAFLTAETYTGKHGLSLRLDGLSESNTNARARAIVIHGADYVNPTRKTQGRSWGCPAVERGLAKNLIEAIKGGSFIYAAGNTSHA